MLYGKHPADNPQYSSEIQCYAQNMSKHHQVQYQQVPEGANNETYGGQDYYEPMFYPPPADYLPPNVQGGSQPPYGPGSHHFQYVQGNNSSVSSFSPTSGSSFTGGSFSQASSGVCSPRIEHTLSSSSIPGQSSSIPGPYSKEQPDMLATMRNRARPWSLIQPRGPRGRAFSHDSLRNQWSVPYEPQMGGLQFSASITPDSEHPMAPPEEFGEFGLDRSRANSHPAYFEARYDPRDPRPVGLGAAVGAALGAGAVGGPGGSAFPGPVGSAFPGPGGPGGPGFAGALGSAGSAGSGAGPGGPARDRASSIDSDAECYSPTFKSEEGRRGNKSAVCPICSKVLKRDLTRHMRTHEEVARFICPFPRSQCPHKRGQFNRPYDFKKHLLHHHFHFHKAKAVRKFRDLHSKLTCRGTCPCGQGNFVASEWLDNHILGGNVCPLVASEPLLSA